MTKLNWERTEKAVGGVLYTTQPKYNVYVKFKVGGFYAYHNGKLINTFEDLNHAQKACEDKLKGTYVADGYTRSSPPRRESNNLKLYRSLENVASLAEDFEHEDTLDSVHRAMDNVWNNFLSKQERELLNSRGLMTANKNIQQLQRVLKDWGITEEGEIVEEGKVDQLSKEYATTVASAVKNVLTEESAAFVYVVTTIYHPAVAAYTVEEEAAKHAKDLSFSRVTKFALQPKYTKPK